VGDGLVEASLLDTEGALFANILPVMMMLGKRDCLLFCVALHSFFGCGLYLLLLRASRGNYSSVNR
jgi:hypothetical protein